MKAMNYVCVKLEEKKPLEVLKTIKTTLSMLQEINLPWVLDEEN